MIVSILELIWQEYPVDTPLRRLLLQHSEQVRDKALRILDAYQRKGGAVPVDRQLVCDGAMLHDIGIARCNAPSICCHGAEPYMAHGIVGAEIVRAHALSRHASEWGECMARFCERHTGTGITAAEIASQSLPLPARDYLPETPEEKLICLADKFFTKSRPEKELALSEIRKSMQKFGADCLARLDALCNFFHYDEGF